MRFLVTGEAVDVGPVLPPAQVVQFIENVINPSLEMIAQWEQANGPQGTKVLAAFKKAYADVKAGH